MLGVLGNAFDFCAVEKNRNRLELLKGKDVRVSQARKHRGELVSKLSTESLPSALAIVSGWNDLCLSYENLFQGKPTGQV